MTSCVYKNIRICILNTAFISALFFSITNANAKLITFKYEGVIIGASLDVSRSSDEIGLLGLLDGGSTTITTGYTRGDKFSGEYTFESEHPITESDTDDFEYGHVILKMSFVSGHNGATRHDGVALPHLRGRNTLNATNGSIIISDFDSGDDRV